MDTEKKNFAFNSLLNKGLLILFLSLLVPVIKSVAEDEKRADIKLTFTQTDSTRTCKAFVTAANTPVKGTEVHFYVKRMYNPLPIGRATETDENGEAVADFPIDLPGDKSGNIIVIAKIEDDDSYGTVLKQEEVKWGVVPKSENENWSNRSLSASRERAPMYLIVVSNLIIAVIWGTLFYVIFQLFRIRKVSRLLKKKK